MVTALDLSLFNFIHALAGLSGFTDGIIIFFAKYMSYLVIIAVIFVLIRIANKKEQLYAFIQLALTIILSRALITEIIRFFYNRPRPFAALGFDPLFAHDTGGAMPSGHATFFFGLAFAILLYYSRKAGLGKRNIGWWYIGAAVIMGVCRVAAGVHWPLDIIVGVGVALVGAWVVDWLLERVFVSNKAA